jgi:dTMP kinase
MGEVSTVFKRKPYNIFVFSPFNLFNLVQLPLEKSQNIVALKKFNNNAEKHNLRGNLIAICGVDGSGKTTQVELLSKYLASRGVKFKCLWFRWTVFLSYSLLALCRLLGYTKWRTVSKSNIRYAERSFYRSRALARLWPWLFTLDVFIYSFFQIKVRRVLGYIILCDRFIPDIIVDMMCETRDYQLPKRLVGRLLLSLIPKNSKLIVMDVAENIAYSRKNDVPSLDYLKERRKLYLALAKTLSIPVINGEEDINKIHEEILKLSQIF